MKENRGGARKGAGRPKVHKGETTTITFRCTRKTRTEFIKKHGDNYSIRLSELMRADL